MASLWPCVRVRHLLIASDCLSLALCQGSSAVKKVMERVHEENMIRSLFKAGELP
jgi:hypothetical protein